MSLKMHMFEIYMCVCIYSIFECILNQAQKKDQSKFYGELLEKRRTAEEKEQEK